MIITKRKATVQAYSIYRGTENRDIYDAYNRPSAEKERVWRLICEYALYWNGRNPKVLTRNTFTFTAGFIGTLYYQGRERKAFFHCTPKETYVLILD